MTETIDLAAFASATRQRLFVTDDELAVRAAALTTPKTKQAAARRLVLDATGLFQIPDGDVDGLVAEFADPNTRDAAEQRLHTYPFASPSTTMVATGYSLILDSVFADRGGRTDVVAVPAYWSLDLWHHERDLTECGYQYTHWVYATLPAVYDWDCEVPVAYVLVSDRLCGRLYWGNRVVHLFDGQVDVEPDRATAADLGRLAQLVGGVA